MRPSEDHSVSALKETTRKRLASPLPRLRCPLPCDTPAVSNHPDSAGKAGDDDPRTADPGRQVGGVELTRVQVHGPLCLHGVEADDAPTVEGNLRPQEVAGAGHLRTGVRALVPGVPGVPLYVGPLRIVTYANSSPQQARCTDQLQLS